MRTRWRIVSVDPALHGLCDAEGVGATEALPDPGALPKEHRNISALNQQHSERGLERRRAMRAGLARVERLHLTASFVGGPQGVRLRMAVEGQWRQEQKREEEPAPTRSGKDVCLPMVRGGKVLVLLPHAHVMPDVALACLRFEGEALSAAPPTAIAVVQLPCCKFDWHDTVVGVKPDVEVLDARICARARCVRVWRDVSSRFDFGAAATGPGVPVEAWGSSEAQARKQRSRKAKVVAKINKKTKRQQRRRQQQQMLVQL